MFYNRIKNGKIKFENNSFFIILLFAILKFWNRSFYISSFQILTPTKKTLITYALHECQTHLKQVPILVFDFPSLQLFNS